MKRFINFLFRLFDDPIARRPDHPRNNRENLINSFRQF